MRQFVGGLVVFGFIVMSTAVAARFGWHLGEEQTDRILFATAGGLADVFKALLPLFIVGAWAARHYVRSALALGAFLVFTAYSLTASFGLAALLKEEKIGGRTAIAAAYRDERAALAKLDAQRKALGMVQPVGVIEAHLAKLKLDRAWQSSSGCTNATATASRALCAQVQDVEAQLASAKAATALDDKIAAARSRLGTQDAKVAVSEADPQAAAIAKASGLSQDTIRLGLHATLAIVLELGSGLGLFLVFGHHGGQRAPREASSVFNAHAQDARGALADVAAVTVEGPEDAIERFVTEEVVPSPGDRVAAGALFAAYETWCERNGREPVSAAMFGRLVPLQKDRVGGRVWYRDARLAQGLRVAVDNGRAPLGIAQGSGRH